MWKKPHNWLIAIAGLLIVVLLGFQVWILVDFFTTRLPSGLKMSSVYSLSIGAIFPTISIILLSIAVKLAADEGTAQRIARAFSRSQEK